MKKQILLEDRNQTMKLLHLFSNWRWTGPAEPVTNLVSSLHHSGWDITFSFGQELRTESSILRHAQKLDLPIHTGLRLQKHSNLLRDYYDVLHLRQWLNRYHFNIVHAHLRNAHLITALAMRPITEKPLIIRSCYAGEGPLGLREKLLLKHSTDGLIVISDHVKQKVINNFNFPDNRIWSVHTPIDINRFNPHRGLGDLRAQLGIKPNDFVVGIIARIQWRRRYQVFLEGIDRARRKLPNLKAIIVGRGTNMKPIVIDPINKMKLNDVIILPGYQSGDDFVRTIASMNVNVFLVPGTDGSCRAVRETMAMGIPTIASPRGILPALVENNERGLIIDDTPENLANAILKLAHNQNLRNRLGHQGREFALEHFSLEQQADIVGGIYRNLAELGKR